MDTDWNTTEPPRNSSEIIVWTSSRKGFPDITASIYWSQIDGCWRWVETDDKFRGPIHGWILYPQPAGGVRPDGTKSCLGGYDD